MSCDDCKPYHCLLKMGVTYSSSCGSCYHYAHSKLFWLRVWVKCQKVNCTSAIWTVIPVLSGWIWCTLLNQFYFEHMLKIREHFSSGGRPVITRSRVWPTVLNCSVFISWTKSGITKKILDIHTIATVVFNICTHQTSLGKQQLDSCLAGSSPTGWADMVEDLCDGRVVPGGHSILAQCLLNELQHRVLRKQNSLPSTKQSAIIVCWFYTIDDTKKCNLCIYLLITQ